MFSQVSAGPVDSLDGLDGPTPDELASIEAEWPLIEAGLDLVDAEIAAARHESPMPLDWQRIRSRERRVLRVAARLPLVHVAEVAVVRAEAA